MTIHERVEFALRDANFDIIEALRIADLAATPAQTVDVEAVREVIATLRHPDTVSIRIDHMADKLSQAIGDKT